METPLKPPPCSPSHVQVNVRARPILSSDGNADTVLDIDCVDGGVAVALEKTFAFDVALDSDSCQSTVYGRAVQSLVGNFIFDASNVAIVAYGQTGAGKTHTMIGEADDCRGVIPRAIEDVIAGMGEDDLIRVSFFEILNDKVHDLLSDTNDAMQLRQEAHKFFVPGLTSIQVESVEESQDLLLRGCQSRSTGATTQNKHSSRSHAIFQLTLERTLSGGELVEAKLSLVDLAGSESVRKTQASGERLTEANHINKGLLALGNCISNICSRKHHIPFRDSTLTKVLKDSLQGEGWTAMIMCISPAEKDMPETINTLRYADRVKQMKKPPIPPQSFQQTRDVARKRRLAQMLPPTPLHWKRRINNTIETHTPTKRVKPNPSRLNSTVGVTPLSARMLQDIDEEEEVKRFSPSSDVSSLPGSSTAMNSTVLDPSLLSPVLRKFTDQLEKKFFSRFEETIRQEMQSIRRSPRLKSGLAEQLEKDRFRDSITDMVDNLGKRRLCNDETIIKPNIPPLENNHRKKHLVNIEATTSPNLPKRRLSSCDKENIEDPNRSPPSPSMEEMRKSLGLNFNSPGMEMFASPTLKKDEGRTREPKKRSVRRTTMLPMELSTSLSESVVRESNDGRRRSVRIAKRVDEQDKSPGRQSEFKQPHQLTSNWKVQNQQRHNQSMLTVLNTANLSVLQNIPAIGAKTAYLLLSHRELHNGFKSFNDIKDIPCLRKNFFANFLKAHQIVL